MTIEQLRQAHHARPFRPFTIHLADGRSLYVRHPDYLSHTPTGRTVIVLSDDEAYSVIDLLLVTALEFHADRGRPEAPGEAA